MSTRRLSLKLESLAYILLETLDSFLYISFLGDVIWVKEPIQYENYHKRETFNKNLKPERPGNVYIYPNANWNGIWYKDDFKLRFHAFMEPKVKAIQPTQYWPLSESPQVPDFNPSLHLKERYCQRRQESLDWTLILHLKRIPCRSANT